MAQIFYMTEQLRLTLVTLAYNAAIFYETFTRLPQLPAAMYKTVHLDLELSGRLTLVQALSDRVL